MVGKFQSPCKVNFVPPEEPDQTESSPLLPRKEPVEPPRFSKVSCSETFTAAVTDNGELWIWGQGMKFGNFSFNIMCKCC